MKKKIILLILLIGTTAARAVVNIYSDTYYPGIGFTDDVVIHSGATLELSGSNQMGPGVSITVLDGGELYLHDGFIVGIPGSGMWEGIRLEQTPTANPSTSWGVRTSNFRIEDAQVAICATLNPQLGNASSSAHNRKLNIYTTVFTNNGQHIKIYNTTSGPDIVSSIESYTNCSVYVQNCDFQNSTYNEGFPIHILLANRIIFSGCTFAGGSNESITLHQNTIVNGRVSNCDFSVTAGGIHAIDLAYHGTNKNNSVTSNTFNLSTDQTGIDLGQYNSSRQIGLNIVGNSFLGSGIQLGRGIYGGQVNSSFYQVKIESNEFSNLYYGIRDNHFDSENEITKNTFSNCKHPLYFTGDNPGVKIECNTFYNNFQDLIIAVGSTLQNQNFSYDPGNTWSVVDRHEYNIVNYGTTNFFYNYNANYPVTVPTTTTSNYVMLTYTNGVNDCSNNPPRKGQLKIENSLEKNTEIEQFPNPTVDYFTVNLNGVQIDELTMYDITGKIVQKELIYYENTRIDLGNLEKGIYFCVYSYKGVVNQKIKLIIK